MLVAYFHIAILRLNEILASCNTNHFHTGFWAVRYSKHEQYLASRIKRIMSRSCDLWRMVINMVKMQCTTSSTSKDARCVNKYSLENDRFIISIYDILRISRERLETEMNTIYFSKVIAVYQFPILQKVYADLLIQKWSIRL